jgi:hypothetical protein
MVYIKILFFYIDDCDWCHWVSDEVVIYMNESRDFADVEFIKIDGHGIEPIYRGLRTGYEMSSEMDVHFFPTLVLVDEEEVEYHRIIGVANKDEYWYNLESKIKDIRNQGN